MKRYFVYGKEISQQRAEEIQRKNSEYMNSMNFEQIAKCKFVFTMNAEVISL